MAPRRSPDSRAAETKRRTEKVRRRYKVNVTKRKKFTIEGEEQSVKDMIVVMKLASYTNTQIAQIVGVSRGQVIEYLKDENVQKRYMRLREALPQAALELGQAYLIEAVASIADVMRTSEKEDMVLKAAAELLDRFGIPKTSRTESNKPEDENPLSDVSLMDRIRKASPETQVAAAELHEMFEAGVEQLLSKESDNGAS